MKLVLFVLFSLVSQIAAAQSATQTVALETAVIRMQGEAKRLAPLVKSELAKEFLDAATLLPTIAPRTIYRDAAKQTYLSRADFERKSEEERRALTPVPITEDRYYDTKYGSPLAYVRALEILGQAGMKNVSGKKILDFGYGTVGHLRLLASLGAEVVGVDVDPFLTALYSEPGDTGTIKAKKGKEGKVTLLSGRFPTEEAIKTAVGGGYDLIMSKNTLKNGYIHPEKPVDKRLLVDLGVDDETFVRALFAALKPGGRVLIYNLYPAQSPPDQPYKPWADGRCPFPVSLWEKVGFKVLAFDQNDTKNAHAMGRALEWDKGQSAMDFEKDLFALYTLIEKPAR
jgi:SAM-dependent methyltransferase